MNTNDESRGAQDTIRYKAQPFAGTKFTFLSENKTGALLNTMPTIYTSCEYVILRCDAPTERFYTPIRAGNIATIIDNVPHYWHEVILLTKPFHFFIDYDHLEIYYPDDNIATNKHTLLSVILNGVEEYIKQYNKRAQSSELPLLLMSRQNVIILDSSREQNDNYYKYSFHIIFRDIILSNNTEAMNIYKWLNDFGLSHIDNVYSSVRNMRMLGGQKDKSVMSWLDAKLCVDLGISQEHNPFDTIITVIDPVRFAQYINAPSHCTNEHHDPIEYLSALEHDGRIREIMATLISKRIWDLHENFTIGSLSDKYIQLRRRNASYCQICNRTHENENAWISIYNDRRGTVVRLSCFRSLRGALSDTSHKPYLEYVLPIEDEERRATVMPSTYLLTMFNNRDELTKHAHDEYHIPCGKICSMMDFTFRREVHCTFIRAGTGSGKTTALINYIHDLYNEYDDLSIIFLSFRKTFSANITERLQQIHMQNYDHIKGTIRCPNIVIQVDSIQRLDLQYYRSRTVLLVMDEIVAILKHMMTSRFLNLRQKTIVPFVELMQMARWSVVMDAYLRNDHVEILSNYMCARGQLCDVIVDERPTDAQNTFIFYPTYRSIIEIMINTLLTEPILVACSTLRDAEIVRNMIISLSGLDAEKIMVYNSNTPRPTITEHFADLDRVIDNYAAVIYTPTLTCGVSSYAPRNHVFAFFDFMQPYMLSEECMQMIKRNRTVRMFHIFMKCNIQPLFHAPFSFREFMWLTGCQYIGHMTDKYKLKREILYGSSRSLSAVIDLFNLVQFIQTRTNSNPLAALWRCIQLYGGKIEMADDNGDDELDMNTMYDEERCMRAQYIFAGESPEATEKRRSLEKFYDIEFVSPEHLGKYIHHHVQKIYIYLSQLMGGNPQNYYRELFRQMPREQFEMRRKLAVVCGRDTLAHFYIVHYILRLLGFKSIFRGNSKAPGQKYMSPEICNLIARALFIVNKKNFVFKLAKYATHKARASGIDRELTRLTLKWQNPLRQYFRKSGIIFNRDITDFHYNSLFNITWDHFVNIDNHKLAMLYVPHNIENNNIPSSTLPQIAINEEFFVHAIEEHTQYLQMIEEARIYIEREFTSIYEGILNVNQSTSWQEPNNT